jgi:hypothetical protein
VALGAPWCTLCYADLRPKPAPEPTSAPAAQPAPEPVSVGASAHAPLVDAPMVDALGVIPPGPLPAATVLSPDPHLDAPITKAADIRLAEPGWPCRSCGTVVPMTEDNCPHCHSPFLVPEDVVELTLPGVGNVRRLDGKMRLVLGLVGALGVTMVLVILAAIGGAVF